MSIFDIPQSLLNAVKKVMLTEHELTRREVKQADDKYANEIAAHRIVTNEISGHIFGNSDRLVIPLHRQEHPVKTAVEDHLRSNGFTNTDYENGLTNDKYNRPVSIGKALTKTGAHKELIDNYATHQKTYKAEKATEGHDLQVVISKHPHDVIGMSQGTEWGLRPHETHLGDTRPVQSCMRFDAHQHNSYMPAELKAGTHIAWLTKKGDDTASEPLSRITLRPYTAESNEPGYKSYKFDIPTNSVLHRNVVDDNDIDIKPEDALAQHIHYSMEDSATITDDEYENFHGVDVEKHPTLPKYVATMRFNRPVSKGRIVNFHNALTRELGQYSSAHLDEPVTGTESGEHIPTILVPGGKTYGQKSSAFEDTVKRWTDHNFKPRSGTVYHAKPGIYLDDDAQVINH